MGVGFFAAVAAVVVVVVFVAEPTRDAAGLGEVADSEVLAVAVNREGVVGLAAAGFVALKLEAAVGRDGVNFFAGTVVVVGFAPTAGDRAVVGEAFAAIEVLGATEGDALEVGAAFEGVSRLAAGLALTPNVAGALGLGVVADASRFAGVGVFLAAAADGVEGLAFVVSTAAATVATAAAAATVPRATVAVSNGADSSTFFSSSTTGLEKKPRNYNFLF